jgi:hypothetical protein
MARPWGSADSKGNVAARSPEARLLILILAGLPAEATNATPFTPSKRKPRTEARPAAGPKGRYRPLESHD